MVMLLRERRFQSDVARVARLVLDDVDDERIRLVTDRVHLHGLVADRHALEREAALVVDLRNDVGSNGDVNRRDADRRAGTFVEQPSRDRSEFLDALAIGIRAAGSHQHGGAEQAEDGSGHDAHGWSSKSRIEGPVRRLRKVARR